MLALILQTTALPFLSVFSASPNLVLVLVLILVIFMSFKKVWWAVVLIGFFMDLFSGLPFGLISLGLVLSSCLIEWLNRSIFSAIKFWVVICLVGAGILTYNLILICLSKLFILFGIEGLAFLYFRGSFFDLLIRMMVEIIYNSLIAIFVFYVVKKIFHQTANA